ncbi:MULTISPECIES: DNA/RNA non-specific endonuclease [unclassified Asaia]|uniref:DNA/RNA non-specific endonuclease n=1 Tax=unclassified Asaia TaxID=2685023 RepID=UPI0013156644|nr:DNA/RNA non-specific endonuclease [Asaia sp. W19]
MIMRTLLNSPQLVVVSMLLTGGMTSGPVWAEGVPASGSAAVRQGTLIGSDEACPRDFYEGVPPVVAAPVPLARMVFLCNTDFAVLVSGVTHEPIWVAEHLTREGIRRAQHALREGKFHEETRQPEADRARLSDYQRSGFDRGHMMPSGDAPDRASQQETFSLANMVPQTPDLNRGLWAGVEKRVRERVLAEGEAYVVTGPAYRTDMPVRIGVQELPVPSSTWKAVYLPGRQAVTVYVCKNTVTPSCTQVPLVTLERVTGVNAFPLLTGALRDHITELPDPQAEPYHVSPQLRRLTLSVLRRFLNSMLSGSSPL